MRGVATFLTAAPDGNVALSAPPFLTWCTSDRNFRSLTLQIGICLVGISNALLARSLRSWVPHRNARTSCFLHLGDSASPSGDDPRTLRLDLHAVRCRCRRVPLLSWPDSVSPDILALTRVAREVCQVTHLLLASAGLATSRPCWNGSSLDSIPIFSVVCVLSKGLVPLESLFFQETREHHHDDRGRDIYIHTIMSCLPSQCSSCTICQCRERQLRSTK